ncbi:MAG: MFS transporter [Actinomycetota bacterium]
MSAAAATATPIRLDRRGLTVLGLGHMCTDLCQGAVPALLPFLAAERGYSYAALGGLVLAATIGSSLIQPAFGLLSDRSGRSGRPWLMSVGVFVGGAGVAVAGVMPSYAATVAAIAVSGVGVAAFHPEGARYAGLASGSQRGRGMGMFSVGGNAGFALGPLLATPLVLAFGLEGTLGLVALPALAAAMLATQLDHLRTLAGGEGEAARIAAAGRDDPGAFARLGAVISLRSGIYFGLQAFAPAYLVAELGASETTGNAALTAMLLAGAVGTLVGGELVDRLGARTVLVGSLAALIPFLLVLPLLGLTTAVICLAAIGLLTISTFSVTIVLGQQYLPSRVGLASGVTLGLAIGVGGLAATGLGFVADAYGTETVLWAIAALPVLSLPLAFTLPSTGGPRSRSRLA